MNDDPISAMSEVGRVQSVVGPEPAMVDADGVAVMLGCSSRHVRRLADAGHMPAPVKLGSLTRWPVKVINRWIEDGCPRTGKKRRP